MCDNDVFYITNNYEPLEIIEESSATTVNSDQSIIYYDSNSTIIPYTGKCGVNSNYAFDIKFWAIIVIIIATVAQIIAKYIQPKL